MRRRSFIFFVVVLLSACAVSKTSSTNKAQINLQRSLNKQLILTPHGPINIQGDGGFASYSFSGFGNETNPYLIDGLEIITSNQFGIFISNTSKYFVISNCYVSANEVSCFINDTALGTAKIYNSTFEDGFDRGLRLWRSPGSVAKNNIFTNNGYGGLHCARSPDSIIEDNFFTDNEVALFIGSSNFSIVGNNTCIGNSFDGIWIQKSYNISLTDNYCYANSRYGLYFGNSCYFTFVQNNFFQANSIGIYHVDSNSSLIVNNTVSLNYYGIQLINSDLCEIKNNEIKSNTDYGVYLDSNSNFNKIHHNNFLINNIGGNSQAFDDGSENDWYDSEINEGNYWSNLGSRSVYSIDGSPGTSDPYPLNAPAIYIDDIPPRISGSSDIEFVEGTTENHINWSIFDNNPGNYSIFRNEDLISTAFWVNDALITIYLDHLPAGIHNFTIIADDSFGNRASDIIIVTVTALEKTTFLHSYGIFLILCTVAVLYRKIK